VGRKRLTRAALSLAACINRHSLSMMGSPRAAAAGGWVLEQVGARAKPEVVVA
jgi:hypothetical protein